VRGGIEFLRWCQDGPAALHIGLNAKEVPAIVASVRVEVVALHDAIGVASLEGGVAHVPVQGDVVIDEAVMVMGLCTLR